MTGPDAVSCEAFRDEVAELAVGVAAAAASDRLLAHARECAACQALLGESTVVADHLLHLAPGWEPPAGFELKALAGMRVDQPQAEPRPRVRRAAWAMAAAVLVVVSAVAGLAVGRATSPSSPSSRGGAVLSATGKEVGTVELTTVSGGALVVLTMPEPATWPGTWSCELQSADGRWVSVGSWRAEDVKAGVWATGIDRQLTTATHMRIVDGRGRLIATAEVV